MKLRFILIALALLALNSMMASASVSDIFLNETAFPGEGLVTDITVDAASTPKWLLLDNSWSQTNSYWQTGHADQTPVWALITLSTHSRINQTIWSAYNDQYEPTDFAVQGSNDSVVWTNITRIENNPNQVNTTIHFENGAGDNWLYYRMYVDRWNGGVSSGGGMATLEWSGFNYTTPVPGISFSAVANNATSSTTTGNVINYTTTISTTETLNFCWFTHNDTGTFVNESIVDCGASPYVYDQSFTVTAGTDDYVCGFFGANTTAGTHSQTLNSCFVVSDGLVFLNISIYDRRNGLSLQDFNVTLNNSDYFVSATTDNGTVVFRVNDTSHSARINTSLFGYTNLVQAANAVINVSVPMFGTVYENNVIETSLTTIGFYVNTSNSAQYTSASLVYNGTVYALSGSSNGGVTWYNQSVNVGTITTIEETKEFWWNYTIPNKLMSENFTQTISQIDLISCNPGDINQTLNFSVFDENNVSIGRVNNLQGQFFLFKTDNTSSINRSFDLNGKEGYALCLNPGDATVFTYAEIAYTVPGGFTHRWYLINETLTNTSTYIPAYDFNTTAGLSDFKGVVRKESNFNFFSGVVTSLQRQYLGEGEWRTVQMDKTGDFGLVFFNIREEDTNYRFLFQDGVTGETLKETQSLKLVCTDGVCEYTFVVPASSASVILPDLGTSYSYDNVTKIVTVAWNDPNSQVSSVRIRVTKETLAGTTDICNNVIMGASGSATCNVTGYTEPYNLIVSSSASPEIFNLNVQFGQAVKTFASLVGGVAEGAFYASLIVIMAGTAGITIGALPASGLVLLTLFIVAKLGLITLFTSGALLGIGIVTLIIADRVWKNRK